MNKARIFLTGLALFGSTIAGSQDTLELNPSNFREQISSHGLVITKFYTPWCKVCQEVEPIFDEAAEILHTKNITTAKVDCEQFKDLCEDYHIGIFPTFLVFKGLNNQRAYNGPREVEQFVAYMEKMILPAALSVGQENFESFKTSERVVVMGFFDTEDRESQEFFSSLANDLRDDFTFGVSTDSTLASKENQHQPSIALYKSFDDGKASYDGPLNKAEVTKFINKKSIPWMEVFDAATSSRYFKNGLPLVFLVHEGDEQLGRLVEDLTPVAQSYQDAIQFVTLSTSAPVLPKLGLKIDRYPALMLLNSDNKKYVMSSAQNVTSSSVEAFLQSFRDRKLEEYYRSEPRPESQEGPVAVVVRDTFGELVVDNYKDVLLEFYAPWCGHCKALAPKYEELAELYSEQSDKVAIAKVDATANDLPDQKVSSYPTIKLFKADDKSNPITYNGERTVQALAQFIGEHGTHGILKGHHDEL